MSDHDMRVPEIDAEALAAYVDGRVSPQERARIEEILARDEESYAWLLDTLRAQGPGEAVRITPQTRRWVWIAGGLAAAATLALTLRVGLPSFLSQGNESQQLVAALVEAVGDERYVEGRLTGGFPYGPLRAVPRTGGSQGSSNLALLGAATALQEAAKTRPTPAILHRWGVAQLLLGNWDDGVRSLEEAARDDPSNAELLSDLGAAYVALARLDDSAAYWARALEWSERALHLDPPPVEARFNRALALEGLGLGAQAIAAWEAYLEADADSEWSADARARRAALEAIPQGSRRPATEEYLATLLTTGNLAPLSDVLRRDPQRLREWLEEDAPRMWARAVLATDARQSAATERLAREVAAAYLDFTGDQLPGRALEVAWHSVGAARQALAVALDQYATAASLVRDDRLTEAATLLNAAVPALGAAGSPLHWWGRYDLVLLLAQQGKLPESLRQLDVIEREADLGSYTVLAGTTRNRRGQIYGRMGDQERAIRERTSAIRLFTQAGDQDQVAVMHSVIAEAYRYLGDPASAWLHHRPALQTLNEVSNYRSRHLVLVQAGLTATMEGRFEAALALQQAVVENGQLWQRPSGTATGLLHLARNLSQLGRADEVDAQLALAATEVARIPDPLFRERIGLELVEVKGEVAAERSPEAAIPIITSAIERFRATGFALRLSQLLLLRGRVHDRAGNRTLAEADWNQAVDVLEGERTTVRADQLRLTQAGSLRAVLAEIAHSRVRDGRSPAESLEPVERARARTLVESAIGGPSSPHQSALTERLGDRTGVLYYLVDTDESVAWLVTRGDVQVVRLPVGREQIARMAGRLRRAARASGEPAAFIDTARTLHTALLSPLPPAFTRLRSLIVVPDAALAGVPFGALVNPESGRFVIEAMTVAVAPSGSLLALPPASRRGVGALIVGANRPESLPALPWVRSEVERIAGLYPSAVVRIGAEASRQQFLDDVPRAAVVHFAGHAVGNPANPLLSRLALNPDGDGRSDLYAYELGNVSLAASVVVLSACSTGYVGLSSTDDDGVLAMARPFLVRGAGAVVATVWDVNDRTAPQLMLDLHRQLQAGYAAPLAWRRAALAALARDRNSYDWAAFTVFLGRGGLEQASTDGPSITNRGDAP